MTKAIRESLEKIERTIFEATFKIHLDWIELRKERDLIPGRLLRIDQKYRETRRDFWFKIIDLITTLLKILIPGLIAVIGYSLNQDVNLEKLVIIMLVIIFSSIVLLSLLCIIVFKDLKPKKDEKKAVIDKHFNREDVFIDKYKHYSNELSNMLEEYTKGLEKTSK